MCIAMLATRASSIPSKILILRKNFASRPHIGYEMFCLRMSSMLLGEASKSSGSIMYPVDRPFDWIVISRFLPNNAEVCPNISPME